MRENGTTNRNKHEVIDDRDRYELMDAFQADFFARCKIESVRKRVNIYYHITNEDGHIVTMTFEQFHSMKVMRRNMEAITGKSMPHADEWDLATFAQKIVTASQRRPEM